MVPKPEQGVAEFFKTLAEVSGYTDNVVLGNNLVEVSPSVPADHWGYTSSAKHYGTQWAGEKIKIAADLGYDVEGRGDWDSLSADERRHVWDEYMDWKKSSVGYKIHAAWRDIQDYARQALFDLEDAAAVEEVNNDIDQQYHRATHSQTSKSVGLSDEDRRLMEQPGGFMPSPPVPNIIPGPPSQPPQLPDVGGFTPSPPMSGLLPGAPIRGPQGPIITPSGLTADQAFRQHLAMSGPADPNQGYFPEFEGPNERIDRDRREAKENVRPRTPEEQAAWEKKLRERFAPRP